MTRSFMRDGLCALAALLVFCGAALGQGATRVTVIATCGGPISPALPLGTGYSLYTDQNGNLCFGGTVSATNPSVGTTGAAAPASATFIGVNIGGNLVGGTGLALGGTTKAQSVAIVDASGNQITSFGSTAPQTPLTGGAATATNGLLGGCRFTSSIPTLTDTQQAAAQFDVNCHQFVAATNMILPTANFTRPANTTAYVAGQLLGNSVTAGSVVPLSLTVNSVSGRKVYLRRVVLKKSTTGVTAPNFRLHFYTASPTIASGDGVAYSTTQSGHFCDMDVNMPTTTLFSDGNDGIGTPNNGAECAVAPTTTTVFVLIEARGAYAPGSAEVFTIAQLEVYEP
jgi:hypothetical protein